VLLAAVERKSLENLAATLSDRTLALPDAAPGGAPAGAVVVKGRYSGVYKLEHVTEGWLADRLSRLEVRYPGIRVVFADARRFRRGLDASVSIVGAR
jgi:hypothetical protein